MEDDKHWSAPWRGKALAAGYVDAHGAFGEHRGYTLPGEPLYSALNALEVCQLGGVEPPEVDITHLGLALYMERVQGGKSWGGPFTGAEVNLGRGFARAFHEAVPGVRLATPAERQGCRVVQRYSWIQVGRGLFPLRAPRFWTTVVRVGETPWEGHVPTPQDQAA